MQTVTLPDVQTSLPKLAQTVLHLAEDDFPMPVREPGYFADCLEEDEFRELEIAAAAHCPTTMVP